MGTYSVRDAQDRLSELIDRVLAGEDVVITRDGRPVVELRALKPVSPAFLDAAAVVSDMHGKSET